MSFQDVSWCHDLHHRGAPRRFALRLYELLTGRDERCARGLVFACPFKALDLFLDHFADERGPSFGTNQRVDPLSQPNGQANQC